MKNWFIIRADANVTIGIGHIMRCLALVEWALDYDLTGVLITRELPKGLEKNIASLNVKVKLLPYSVESKPLGNYAHSAWLPTSEKYDAVQTELLIEHELLERNSPPSFIIVDHYALAAPWENQISRFAPILCIDDLNDRPHQCKWLIDQTFNKTSESYIGLVNESCEVFTGTFFALLRKEFHIQKHTGNRDFPDLTTGWNILITLGGVDKFNITGLILKLLTHTKLFHQMNITTVVGSSNPNIKELELICSKVPKRLRLLIDVNNMSSLMSESDLCIGAAGSTSWERCAMSLPTLMIVLADNQLTIAKNLDKEQVCFNMGKAENINLQYLEENLLNIMTQPDIYMTMVNNSKNACDGLGCQRILDTLMRDITC
jgi:UDP-2,4-diacetamido-2,4,6-trideoxy-beta-L-altropyranose hydrolase